VSVATDSHRMSQLDYMESGLEEGRRGWLEAPDIVNCLAPAEFEDWLRRKRG